MPHKFRHFRPPQRATPQLHIRLAPELLHGEPLRAIPILWEQTLITLNVNGKTVQANVTDKDTPLLWVLRDVLGLTGTKYGCGIEVCGACTVLIDGQREHSCVFDVGSAIGKQIVTIEGLSPAGTQNHPVQQAWIRNQVPQCGYCQPGMIMACVAGMKAGHHGSELLSEMKHLCVCGTYQRIRDTVANL